MTPRNHPAAPLVLTIALAVTLLPAAARAQAGLSGDPFGGQEAERSSQFDKTFQSKSALGQLEQLTGGHVDRPSSQRNTVSRVAPQARSVTPRFDANQAFKQEMTGALAGALVGALFADLLSDNSAQERAAAEAAAAQRAAQAAAEAEAFRVQQELARQARIRQAQRYRAEWDARETEVTDRLGGAFDVTPATSFFGRPANPDADVVAKILSQDIGSATQASGGVPDAFASDPSVVDLRGSSLVVQPLRPPTGVAINGRNSPIPRPMTQASVTPPWGDNWSESEPPPDPSSKWGKWWTHVRSYTNGKVIDLNLAYLFMGIKEAGGNSIDALASIPEKAKAAIDLKKNLEESVNRSVGSTFSIAGQLTNPNADGDALVNQWSERFHTGANNFTDNSRKGIFDNLSINIAPEGAVSETGIGIAQGVHSDLADWFKWGKGDSGGP
jgi:hypothetical protein